MSFSWIVVGCLEETRDTLTHLASLGEKPNQVVSISCAEARRQKVTNYVDLKSFATAMDIPYAEVGHYGMKTPEDIRLFRELKPNVVVVLGWQRLVPEAVLRDGESELLGSMVPAISSLGDVAALRSTNAPISETKFHLKQPNPTP